MLTRSFLIKSSSKLLVIRTGIKAWSSSILGRIRPLILELLALEWRKFHNFELEYSSLKPVGQSWLNFMCSIIEVGERLRTVSVQIGSKLWLLSSDLPWLLKTGLKMSEIILTGRKTQIKKRKKKKKERKKKTAEKTTFDLGTLDSGERSLPFELLFILVPS